MTAETKQYLLTNGSLYEYHEEYGAYIYVFKIIDNLTEKEAIKKYEEFLVWEADEDGH